MQHWNAPIMYVVEMEITKNLKGHVKLRKKGNIRRPAESWVKHAFLECMLLSSTRVELK